MTKKYAGLKKSRKNTSGKPSAAKKQADERAKVAKARAKGKVIKAKKPKPKKKPMQSQYSYQLRPMKANAPVQLPETPLSKKGMNLRGLVRSTPRLMINNSADVEVLQLKKTVTKSGMPAVQAACYTDDPFRPNKVRRIHRLFVIGLDKTKSGDPDLKTPISKHKRVLVSCPCENYTFTWEYANAAHGCSRIVYSNGEPPVMTNPNLAPGLCKHLAALSFNMIKKGI